MIARRHGRSLFRQSPPEEDVNPNAYLTNLADCMLVMVVGLLIALVTHYNVDLQQQDEPDETVGTEVTMDADGDGEIDGNYEATEGTVYRDSETGAYYLVTGE